MFVFDEPFVSDFAVETLNKFDYPALKNEILSNRVKNLIDDSKFIERYKQKGKVYTNSENSLKRITSNLSGSPLQKNVELFKNKTKFREALKKIYPDFFYRELSFDEVLNLKFEELKTPCVIKPAVGFLSMGVFCINSREGFLSAIQNLKNASSNSNFPKDVVNYNRFIIEEYIEGDEYAADVYFDGNSNPVVLNVYYHPFVSSDDVSDRMYISSAEIILNCHNKLEFLLSKMAEIIDLKNFPFHIEFRIKGDRIIPIEVNPLRFAGWCLCDLAYFAYGINVYKYFMEDKKPDWKEIGKNNKSTFAFVMGEVPADIDKHAIISFDKDSFKKDLGAEILNYREFDYKTKPIFATVFIKAESCKQIKHILNLDIKKYIGLR